MYWWLFLLCPLGYLIGSFNFSKTLAKLRHVDLSKVGSGNAGATNVGRAMGFKWFLLVTILEAIKCVTVVLIGYFFVSFYTGEFNYLHSEPHYTVMLAMGLAGVFGAIYPIWYGFHGGKGIATWMGVGFVLNPLVMLAAAAIFTPLLMLTRIMSVSTLLGVAFWVGMSLWLEAPLTTPIIVLYCCFLVLIYWAHRRNLVRLFTGTEKRLVFKK